MEIKFRVRCKTGIVAYEKLALIGWIWCYADRQDLWFSGVFNLTRMDGDRYLEDVIREQFVGLKDKNGVEIYDGDIIAVLDWTMPFEVGFDKGSFSIINLYPTKTVYHAIEDYKQNGKIVIEIIGNRHENPELLGGGE